MTDRAPDDIFALFSQFELDTDHYRVFHREPPTLIGAPAQVVLSAKSSSEEVDSGELLTIVQHAYEGTVSEPCRIEEAAKLPPHAPTPIRPEINEGRDSLERLSRHLSSNRNLSACRTADSLAAVSISVTGVAGGVGATTISATLTRMLAKGGPRCGLFDDTEDPALSIFFGAQRTTQGQSRFAGLRSMFDSQVRIVNRKAFEGLDTPFHPDSTFIGRNFATVSPDFDHLIFDRPVRALDCSGAGVQICVAVPDVSSLARVQKTKLDLNARHGDGPTICVLNRFDSSIPLHQEILNWYRDNFEHLVVIRESSLVPEALAEGTTVVDWVPESPVAADYSNLITTVRHAFGMRSERLCLCS